MIIKQYWMIKCTKHLKTLFECKVSVNHLSEKRLKEFIQTLIAKYILTPQEILDEHKSIPFKKRTQYVHITRTNEERSGKMKINFMADSAGISIVAFLIEEIE